MTKKRGPGRPTKEHRVPLHTTIKESRLKRLEELSDQTGNSLGQIVDQQLDQADPMPPTPKKGKP